MWFGFIKKLLDIVIWKMVVNVNLIEDSNKEVFLFKVFKIIVYFVIFFLCFFGNILVMIVICKIKWMRILLNLFIFNFVVCDLIIFFVSILFDLVLEEKGYIWFFGRVFCKIFWLFVMLLIIFVFLILVIILLDCYWVIMYFFK